MYTPFPIVKILPSRSTLFRSSLQRLKDAFIVHPEPFLPALPDTPCRPHRPPAPIPPPLAGGLLPASPAPYRNSPAIPSRNSSAIPIPPLRVSPGSPFPNLKSLPPAFPVFLVRLPLAGSSCRLHFPSGQHLVFQQLIYGQSRPNYYIRMGGQLWIT